MGIAIDSGPLLAAPLRRAAIATSWTAVWDWVARPMHYRAVHAFRIAAQSGDGAKLASLLDERSAVVVEAGDARHPAIRVVRGAYEAIALLMHGMSGKPGLVISERSVNGQAGLMLSRGGRAIATITIDFTGRIVSTVWIQLNPYELRHWNHV
jgi:hypothetical protein